MSKYTKIVATISDARCDVDFIKQLYESGMNVVRMNSAHLQEEGFIIGWRIWLMLVPFRTK